MNRFDSISQNSRKLVMRAWSDHKLRRRIEVVSALVLLVNIAIFGSAFYFQSKGRPIEAAPTEEVSDNTAPKDMTKIEQNRARSFQKVTKLEDGQYQAEIHSVPVQYLDQSTGSWNDIDTNIKAMIGNQKDSAEKVSGQKDKAIVVDEDNLSSSFSTNPAGDLVMTTDTGTITNAYLGVSDSVGVISKNSILYADAYTSTDIERIFSPGKVKQNIIFKERGHPKVIKEKLDTSFRVEIQADNSIKYFDGSEVVATTPPIFLMDADGARQDVSLRYDNKTLEITILKGSKRLTYPLILDPTTTLYVANTNDDGYVAKAVSNYGSVSYTTTTNDDTIYAGPGYDCTDYNTACWRGFVRFAIPGVSGTINSATVYFRNWGSTASGYMDHMDPFDLTGESASTLWNKYYHARESVTWTQNTYVGTTWTSHVQEDVNNSRAYTYIGIKAASSTKIKLYSWSYLPYITITYTPSNYTMDAYVDDGSGSVSGGGTYSPNATATVTAYPDSGWQFSFWTHDCAGQGQTAYVTMNGNKLCGAQFDLISTYTMTTSVASGSGSVSGAGTYNSGATAYPVASPSGGWGFSSWGGDCAGQGASASVVMNGNKSCSANFYQITYTMSTGVNSGSGSVGGAGTYNSGDTATVTAYPSSRYGFNYWDGDCAGQGQTAYVGMNGNKSCSANFYFINSAPPMSTPSSPNNGAATRGDGTNQTFVTNGVSDPDGDTVYYYFRVATGSDAEAGTVCNSGWQTSTSYTCNPGQGTRYWHVYTYDGYAQTNPNYVWSFLFDTVVPTYNSTAFQNCNYTSGSNCYVKNGQTFYVLMSHSDALSGAGTQYLELSKNGANRGTWDGATGNIKSYASLYGVSNSGYSPSFTDGAGMTGAGYLDIQNAQCIQAGNCNSTAYSKWQIVASSGASTAYGVTVYMYDQASNGVGYTDTGMWVYLDNSGPTINVTDGANASWNTSDTITVTSTDGASGAASTYYGFSADATCNASDTYGTSGLTLNVTTNHTDYVCFKSTDNVGNISYSTAIGPLHVDSSAPPAPTLTCTNYTNNTWTNSGATTVCSINDTATPSPRTAVAYSTNNGGSWTDNANALSMSAFTPAEGTTNVIMRISDTGGGPTNSNTYVIKRDVTAPPVPTLTCTNYTNNTWTNSGATTVCSINDSATPSTRTAVAYSTNGGGSWTDNANALSMSAFTPAEGTTNVIMRISDTGGGPTNSNTYVIKRDNSAPPVPTLTCTNYTSGTWQNTNPATSCSINDSATPSPRTAVAYSTNNGGSWTDNANGLSFGFTPTANASTSVIMRISDTGGGPASSNTYVLRPDTSGPTINVTDGANASWNTSDTITVTSTDGASGVVSTYYGFSADATCNVSDTYGTSGLTLNVTTNHTDYVCFKSTDNVGNISYSTAIGPLKVDTSAPPAPTLSCTNYTNNTWTNSAATTVCSINDSATPSTRTAVAYSTNGGTSWTDNANALSMTAFTPAEGTTNVIMRISDTGGGPTNSNTYVIKRDVTAPTTSGAITAGTAGSNGWYTSNVTYTITPADATSGVASTVYCTDTAGSCTPGTSYTTALTISTESATNHVRFRSTDNAGNVQTVQDSGVIKIDKTAPRSPAIGITTPTPGYTTGTTQRLYSGTTHAYDRLAYDQNWDSMLDTGRNVDNTTQTFTWYTGDSTIGLTEGVTETGLWEGEVYFSAGAHGVTMMCDNKGYVEFYNGTSNGWQNVINNAMWGSYVDGVFTAPSAAYYKFRAGCSDADVGGAGALLIDGTQGAGTYINTTNTRLAAVSSTAPTFNATFAEGTGTKQYRLDNNATWNTFTGTSISPSGLTEGIHALYVREQDAAGIWSFSGSQVFLVDTVAPTLSADKSSANWYTSNQTVTLSTADATSGLSFSKYSWDTSDATCRASGTAYANTNTITFSTQGTHTLYLCNADNAGLTGAWNGQYKLDTSAPTTSGAITAGTVGSNGWYTTNVTYTITPADAGSGVASTVYCTDTAGSCTPGTTYSTALTISTESATNHVRFRSTDNAGNVQGIQDSGVIKIDKTNPTTTGAITAGTAGSNGWYTSNVTYTITPADATSGPATTVYCADTTNACTPGTTYSTALTISTESATNYIRFRTTDNAGLVQAIQSSGAIKIDKSAPTGSFAINNIHSNTSFESGSDGSLPSSFSNYNGTFEKSSTTYFTGSASGKLTANDPTYGSARAFQDYGGASIGETYTGSIYVKGNGTTIGKTFYLWLYEYNGSSWISTSQSVTLSSAWSRLSVSRTVTNLNSPNSGVVRTEFGFDRTVSGEYVYVDDIQLEKKSSASAYNAWSGSTNTNILYTSSTDALSGASQMLFSNDGSTWSSAESYATTKTSYDLTALGGGAGDGTKTVRVKFRDSAGNDSSVYTQSIILDTANPGSFSLLTPSDWSWTTSKRPTLDWGDSTEANLWKYEIYVDAALKKTIEVGSPASTWTLDYDLSEGSHPWYITATDFTGKTYSTFAGFFTVQVDSLKPSSAITAPTGGAYITTSSYNVTGTASNGGSGSAVDHVDISTNGGLGYSVATGTTAWSYTWTTGSDGSYNLKSRATDVAGNVETVGAGTTVIVDRTAVAGGTVNDGVGADATWTKSTTSLSANWNGFTDANGIGKYKYAIGTTAGGTNIVGWTDNGLTTTATVNSLSLSSGQIYYFTVKAYDGTLAESNTRIVNSNGITVDTGLPTSAVTIASTYYGPNTWGASTINGTASDAISGIQKTEITIQRSSDSLYWTGSTWGSSTLLNVGSGSTWSYNLASGNLSDNVTYIVTSKATDNATNAQTSLGSDTFIYDKSNTTPTVNVGVNLLSDSSWEGGGAGGWNYQYGTQGSGANASDKYYGGTKSYKVTRTVAGSEANIYRSMSSTTLKPSTTYYFSVFAWSDTANTACAFSALGSANLSMTCHAGSGKWERLGGTITTDSAGVIQLRLGHQSSTLSSVWFDQVQLEEGVSATTYVNDGYVNAAQWTTTAISGTAADAISGIQKTELTIQRSSDSLYWTGSTWGSSTWLNAGSGATWSYGSGSMTASNLTSGLTYTVVAKTTDNVNNASSTATDTFIYDNTAPTSAVTAPPAYASASTYDSTGGAGNTIRGTAGDTGGSGISRTEITLQRADNSQYWTGSAWGTSTLLWVGGGATWNYTALTSASLTSGVLYRINATTYDQANNSTGATQQTFTYDTAAPTGGSITYTDGNYSTASVALTVSDGTDNGLSGINTGSRIVQRKSATLTAGSCGGYGSFGTITTSGTYPNLVDTSVSNANCYQYQYLVSDNVGNQATYVGTTTAKVDTALPTVPTALTLASITASSINVSWTAASDGGTGLANPAYYIERAPDSSGNPGTWSQIATTNATSYRDSSLSANTKYYYRVRAKDTAGNYSGYSGETNADGNTVGLWHLNDGGSSPTTADSSSYGNIGTLNIGSGGTQTSNTQAWTNGVNGKLGQSLNFDGTDDNAAIGNLGSFPAQGSLEFWMNSSEMANYRNPVTSVYNGGNVGIRCEENASGNFVCLIGDNGGTYTAGTYISSGMQINTWYQITLTWDTSTNNMKGYLNGNATPVFDQANTHWPTNISDFRVGTGFSTDAARQWKGKVDEVRLSNAIRTGTDVSNYYAESNPQPKGAYTLSNAPTALTLIAASTSQINVSWTAPTGGTDHYHLYSSSNSYASPIYNSTGVSTSQSGLSSNTQYTYRLYAVNADGLESSMAGEENADVNTVGLWHLNGGTSGSIANNTTTGFEDTSGNSNNGTAKDANGTGMAWTNAKLGNGGVNYDGTDDYITHPVTNFNPAAKSIEMWVKPNWNWNDGVNHGLWQNNDNTSVNQGNWVSLFKYGSNILYFRVANPSGGLQDCAVTATGFFTSGSWTYVAATYNSSGMKVYINGNQVCSSGAITVPNANLDTTGRIGFGHTAPFSGVMDEVRISNTALSGTDISNYYNESNPYPRSRYTLANTPVLATPTTPTSNNRPTVSAAVAYDAALSNATIRLYDNGTLKATTTANSPLGDFSFTSGTYGANTLADGNHNNITARSVNGDGVESPDSGAKTILVDTVAPLGGTVNDGTGVDQDWNNGALNSLSANWSGFTDGTSGLQKYEYSIRRKPDDYYWNTSTNVWQSGASWYNNALTTTVTVSPVYLQTSTIYYISVRATDLAGNTASPVSSNGQRVTPNLTFSINTNAMTFANLNAGNGNTDSKTVTTTTTTNASGGYSAYIYEPNLLTSIPYPAITIPNYAGTWAVPTTWAGYGFGYTSSDALVQGSNRFGGATKYAGFASTAPGNIFADNAGPVNGQTGSITNEQFTLTGKVAVSGTQVASAYATNLLVLVTANY